MRTGLVSMTLLAGMGRLVKTARPGYCVRSTGQRSFLHVFLDLPFGVFFTNTSPDSLVRGRPFLRSIGSEAISGWSYSIELQRMRIYRDSAPVAVPCKFSLVLHQ